MTYRRSPLPSAVVPPELCWLLSHEIGASLERLAHGLSLSPRDANRAMATKVQRLTDELEVFGRMWRDGLGDHVELGPQIAASGNAAMPSDAGSASSESPVVGTREVAEMLGLRERQVRNLCLPEGPLSATKRGGHWLIDQGSAETYRASRRPVA